MNSNGATELTCPKCGTVWELTPEESALDTFTCTECACSIEIPAQLEDEPVDKLPGEDFLPRIQSKGMFIFLAVSCGITLQMFVSPIAKLCGFGPRPGYRGALDPSRPFADAIIGALVEWPVLQSLALAGIIEATRRLRLAIPWQLLISVTLLSFSDGLSWPGKAIIVSPFFLICAYSYLLWKRESWKTGCFMIILIHSASNLISVLTFIERKLNTGATTYH